MRQMCKTTSPAMYWGKKFLNSSSRCYVYLVAYLENPKVEDSIVYYSDMKGRILNSKGQRWELFLISHIPSMLPDSMLDGEL